MLYVISRVVGSRSLSSLITVQVFFDRSDAVVAKSFLEAHGISVFVPDWHTVANAWHWTTALHGIRLCTFASDAKVATELLADIGQEPVKPGTLPVSELLLAVFAYVLAGIPHPVRRR